MYLFKNRTLVLCSFFLLNCSFSQISQARSFEIQQTVLKTIDKNGDECIVDADSKRNFHFSPLPKNLIAKTPYSICKEARYFEFYSNDNLVAVSFGIPGMYSYRDGKNHLKNQFAKHASDYCNERADTMFGPCFIFADGEVWKPSSGSLFSYELVKVRSSDKSIEKERLKAAEKQRKYNERANKFRRNLKVGDETSKGMVIRIKGNLIKIQTNESQCSQRNYDGDCVNWINNEVEKWVKRKNIYPKN